MDGGAVLGGTRIAGSAGGSLALGGTRIAGSAGGSLALGGTRIAGSAGERTKAPWPDNTPLAGA